MKMWLLLLGLAVTSAAATAGPGSCVGRCGEVYTRGQQCTCDFSCLQHGDCCQDFESTCTTGRSCLGRCGETFRRGRTCDCDRHCAGYDTCCRDHRPRCGATDASAARPRPSQRLKAPPSGGRRSQWSKEESNSESEERYRAPGAFGFYTPLSAGPALSTNQLQHGVGAPSFRGPPDAPAPGSSLPDFSAPSSGSGASASSGALHGSNQGVSGVVGYRPRPGVTQDVAQALGLSAVEADSEGPGHFADVGLCSDSPINGLTALGNGTILIFKGELFWPVDPATRSVGRPQRITDTLGVPAPIDTVFTRCNCHGNTYIIKGDQCWRLDRNMAVEPGFPKPLASEFPGLTGSIGAALAVPATRSTLETVYFFNTGDKIQRFTFSPGSVPSCSASPRSVLKTQLADVLLSGELNIKVSLKGFPKPVTSALSTPSPQRSDRFHHYVFTGPLFFSVQIVEDWPAPTKPDPSSALVPLPIHSPADMATNMVNPPHPPNSIRVWLRCP